MSTVLKNADGGFRMYSKGASEIVLRRWDMGQMSQNSRWGDGLRFQSLSFPIAPPQVFSHLGQPGGASRLQAEGPGRDGAQGDRAHGLRGPADHLRRLPPLPPRGRGARLGRRERRPQRPHLHRCGGHRGPRQTRGTPPTTPLVVWLSSGIPSGRVKLTCPEARVSAASAVFWTRPAA